jgi:hypothetical protein
MENGDNFLIIASLDRVRYSQISKASGLRTAASGNCADPVGDHEAKRNCSDESKVA